MSRIIFINRYYRPDHSATAQLLTDLAEYLAHRNKSVVIVTSRLRYDIPGVLFLESETIEGVQVKRVWTSSFGRGHLIGRGIDYLTFYVSCFFTLLFTIKSRDIVVAKTDPPLISVVAAIVCFLKGATLINWVQDLFPEVARALGVRLVKGPIYGIIRYLRNRSLMRAKANVVLGELMRDQLIAEGVPRDKVTIIHNWVVGQKMTPVPKKENLLRKEWGMMEKFVIGYSGNLGRAHEYETMLKCIEKLRDYNDIMFLFIGGGAGMELLRQSVREKKLGNVEFKPYQQLDKLNVSLSVPDIHLITLQPEMEGLIVPSKFYGILSVHRPIIFIGDVNGEVARILNKSGAGVAVESKNSALLSKLILENYKNNHQINKMTEHAKLLHSQQFSDGVSKIQWQELFSTVRNSEAKARDF